MARIYRLFQAIDPDTLNPCPAPFTLQQWRESNDVQADTYLAEVLEALERLRPGEIHEGGGGASPEFLVRCVGDFEQAEPRETP
jgi:hypothetical protein